MTAAIQKLLKDTKTQKLSHLALHYDVHFKEKTVFMKGLTPGAIFSPDSCIIQIPSLIMEDFLCLIVHAYSITEAQAEECCCMWSTKMIWSHISLLQHAVTTEGKTLLPHYLGMYRLTVNNAESYWIVMKNMFRSSVMIHRKFDLKGSTVDRAASHKEKVLYALLDNTVG